MERKINISKSSNQFDGNESIKHGNRDSGKPTKTFGGREGSQVHRQLKTYYGQLNGYTGGSSHPEHQSKSFNI
jgi:hypothetical protein